MKRWLCKTFGHKWKEIFYNHFGMCSYRECRRCGVAQELKVRALFDDDPYVEIPRMTEEEKAKV